MADKFAVYSDDKDVVDLAQVLSPRKALTVAFEHKLLAGGATFTIPDTGSVAASAADTLVVFRVTRSDGTTTDIDLYLPETAEDGQLLAVVYATGTTGRLVVRRFDGGDTILPGGSSVSLYRTGACLLLQAQESTTTPGQWVWQVLSCVGGDEPTTQRQQIRWNGHSFCTSGGGTKYMDGPVASPAHTDPVPQIVGSGSGVRFVVNMTSNTDTAGDVSFVLKYQDSVGVGTVATVGPYSSGATGVQSASASVAFDLGAILWVEVVSSAGVTSNDGTAYAMFEYLSDLVAPP